MSRRRWKKILYEDQHVPDNYVDESFLDELDKNLYIRTYEYWAVVREAGVVSQQISCVCLFVLIYAYMSHGVLSPAVVFLVSLFLVIIGYFSYLYLDDVYITCPTFKYWNDVKTLTLFVIYGFLFSPVLMTLTQTISTDTVYAMTVFMLLANLLFHDYGTSAAIVSQSVSLNAGIFASVCLASRLATPYHSFVTVTFAAEMFGLWPVLRRKISSVKPYSKVIMTILFCLLTSGVLMTLSLTCAVLYIGIHLFITLICPMILINMQPYKNNIHGPWDEATITDL